MNTTNRFSSLDLLRGLAALLVVWQHSSETLVKLPAIAKNGTFLADIAWSVDFGRIGVICFFLISGFVIPFSLKVNENNVSVRPFAIRRFFRLFPAYWLSIFLALAIALVFSSGYEFTQVFANLTMLQSFFGQPHILGLYWTLQVELVFYILCIILYKLKLLDKEKFLFFMVVWLFSLFVIGQIAARFIIDIEIKSGASIIKELMYMPYLIAIMFLGTIIRLFYEVKYKDRTLFIITFISTCICFGLPVLLLASSLLGFELVPDSTRFGASHLIALCLFLTGLLFVKNISKVFTWLGVISYSIYLFHPLVINLSIKILRAKEFVYLKGFSLGIYMMGIFSLTILFASIIYLVIEKPSMNFGRKLSSCKNE